MKKFLTVLIVFIAISFLHPQNQKIIEIDPITDLSKENLPFDQSFVLKKTFNEPINIYQIAYFEIPQRKRKDYFKSPKSPTKDGSVTKFGD